MIGSTGLRQDWSEIWRTGLLPGALAGLVGGLVFGATMSGIGQLTAISSMAHIDSAPVGFIIVLVGATLIGAGFGALVWYQQPGAGETLFWGLVYGTFWWYLGPLTLLPLVRGDGVTWTLDSTQAAFSVLPGLVLYGATLGLALVFFQWRQHYPDKPLHINGGALFRGGLAGLFAAGLLGAALNSQNQLLNATNLTEDASKLAAWLITLLIGVLAGLGFALLYPRPTDGAGAGLIRGTVYGFFWWVLAPLTLVPLFGGAGLAWSLEEVQAVFAALPGYLLFGAAVALFYQWLGGLVNLLFSDIIGGTSDEGVGTQGLRIVGRSALAGLVGGLLFSLVMFQIGFLNSVADLVGATSPLVGFFVHLGISILIGTSYGVLFHRQTYGAGLGGIFYLLEARFSPWWIPRRQAQAVLVARQKEQVLTAAPALWTLLVAIGLTLPVLLGS